jgi:ribosomal protein S6--L-glutamate ligase
MDNFAVGWEEWLSLPELGLPALKIKTDTGARTSALHAFSIQPFGSEKKPFVRFGVHPIPNNPDVEVFCSAPVVDIREVTSSNGHKELRYVIETPVVIGNRTWAIKITLTNRENMAYRMLLGRSALKKITVHSTESFLQPQLSYELYGKFSKKKPVKRALRIAILTEVENDPSIKRLIDEAELNNHVVELINTKRCYLNIESHNPEVHYDGKPLPFYDAIIPRIDPALTFYGMAVVRQFEAMGTYCLNNANSIGVSNDELAAHQVLARFRIPMPTTAFADSPKDTKSLLNLIGGSPTVLKLLPDSQEQDIIIAHTKQAAEEAANAFQSLDAHFIVQECIQDADGTSIRCFIVGKRVVGAIMKISRAIDKETRLPVKVKLKKAILTPQEKSTVIKSVKALGLTTATVNFIRTEKGLKVLDVSSIPDFEKIEKFAKKNIAQKIINYIEKNARPAGRTKKRTP